jgi:hypothetical protein
VTSGLVKTSEMRERQHRQPVCCCRQPSAMDGMIMVRAVAVTCLSKDRISGRLITGHWKDANGSRSIRGLAPGFGGPLIGADSFGELGRAFSKPIIVTVDDEMPYTDSCNFLPERVAIAI